MEFVYELLDESSKFCLILNWETRSFKTLQAFALYLNISLEETKNIFKKHNAYFPIQKYNLNASTRAYFQSKLDAINCMNELNSILMSNLLRGDYDV